MFFIGALAAAAAFRARELLEIRSTRTLNGERGANVRGLFTTASARTSSALDVLLSEIRLLTNSVKSPDTSSFVLRRAGHQKPDSVTVCSFDNQLATLLEDQEKVGVHGVVMIRLPDFTFCATASRQSGGRADVFMLYQSANIDIYARYPCSLLARYHRSTSPCRYRIER